MGQHQSYKSFVVEAQRLRKQGAVAEADLLYLLIEMEPLGAIWQQQHPTWKDVVLDLKLCPWNRYENFRRARKIFTRSEIQKIGVPGAIVLSSAKLDHQQAVKREALAWVAEHKVPMRSRDASSILRRIDPGAIKVVPKLDGGQWQQRAQLLEAVLLQHGIEVPVIPREIAKDMEGVVDASVMFVRSLFKLKQTYPSCSDQDIAKIAMQQVETASGALKQALGLRPGRPAVKSGAPGPSTHLLPDQVLDQRIDEVVANSPGFITSKMVMEKLAYPEHHRIRIRERIVDKLMSRPGIKSLGKVGTTKAFAVVESTTNGKSVVTKSTEDPLALSFDDLFGTKKPRQRRKF